MKAILDFVPLCSHCCKTTSWYYKQIAQYCRIAVRKWMEKVIEQGV